MKRFLALVLSVVMVFSLVACGSDGKAEKYCWNCGEGISKSDSFCGHCGTDVSNKTTDSSKETESTDVSSKDVESKPSTSTTTASKSTTSTVTASKTTTSKPATTSKPTASKPTTSTTTSKPTTHTHSYSKYVCTGCGAVDKSHAYEYLIEWVKTNGTEEYGDFEYRFKGKNNTADCYGLTYATDIDHLYRFPLPALMNILPEKILLLN